MKTIKFEKFNVQEITHTETKNINGGGWIADLVEFMLCKYCWGAHNEAYSNTMARRGI